MLHPSYTDLMQVVNSQVEEGDSPVVNSRYSIVMATSKRARQLIDGCEPYVESLTKDAKPLSIAVAEVNSGKVKILTGNEEAEETEETEETEAENCLSEEEVPEADASEKTVEEGREEAEEAEEA